MWLEVVDLAVVPLDTTAKLVSPSDPGEISSADELLVAKQEWVSGLRIAQGRTGGPAGSRRRRTRGEDEPRKPVIQACGSCRSGVVSSGNLQVIEPFSGGEIKRLPQPLARETEIPIEEQVGMNRIGRA